jgi:type I restriction enzyme S subunit
MKQGWEIKKLGDICGFVRGPFGGSLKKNIFKPEGYAVYEQQHAIYDQFDDIRYFIDETKFNEMKRFELNSGDLIMSCSGTMGKIAIVPENIKKGIINQALLKLTPSKKISTIFLKLWMQSESFQDSLKEYSGGAAIQNVASVAILKQIEIPLPPLNEQERIVSILDECFAAIDKAKANAEQNLNNARKLFESYLQGVFEKKGDSWNETTLSELFNIKHGFAFQGEYFSNTGEYVLLTPGNFFEEGGYRNRAEKQKYYLGEIPKDFILKKGDLLVAMTEQAAGLLGSPIIVPESNKFLHNQRLGLIIPKPNIEIDNEFFYHFFNLKKVRKALHDSGTGVKVRHTSPTKIGQVDICYPKSIEDQQTIVRQLDALRAETQKLEAVYQKKIADLEELKKSILQKAFAGDLKTEKAVAV